MQSLFVVSDKDELMVAKNFFCEFDGNPFIKCLSTILSGTGYGNEYAMCSFPTDLDEGEVAYSGVKFTMWEDHELIIDEKTFSKIVLEACREYIKVNPDKKNQIDNILLQRHLSL